MAALTPKELVNLLNIIEEVNSYICDVKHIGIFLAKFMVQLMVKMLPKQEIVEKNTLENLCSRLHQSFTKQDHFKVSS